MSARAEKFVGWLFGFYGISTFVGYLTPNPFLCKQFYFKQFNLAWLHNLIKKIFLFQPIQFIHAILIQFSISTEFLYSDFYIKEFSFV